MPGSIERTRGKAAYRRAAHAITVAPVNRGAPAITGTPQVGQTLAVSDGEWSGFPDTYTYQWRKGGVNIAGATSKTYTPVAGDAGATIDAVVTATNSAGSTAETSNSTAAVAA